jgi:O-antigen ligase
MKRKLSDFTAYSLFAYAALCAVSITIAEGCFLLALLFFMIDIIKNKKDIREIFSLYVTVPLFFFAAVHLTAAFAGIDVANSLKDYKKIYIILMCFTAASALADGGKLRRALDFYAAGSIFIGLYCSMTGMFFRFLIHDPDFRSVSFSGNHMHAGGMLMMAAVVLFGLLMFEMKRKQKDTKRLLFYGAAFLCSASGLVFTFTRGSWIAAIIGIAVIMLFMNREVLVAGAIIALLLIIIFFENSFVQRLVSSVSVVEGTSQMERVYMWESGLKMIKNRPILGIGTANVGKIYPKYAQPEITEKNQGHLHNNLIQISVIDGLLGLAAFLWLFTSIFIYTFGGAVRKNGFAGAVSVISAAASAAFFINGLFEYNLFSSQVALIYWFILGLAFAAGKGGQLEEN